MCGITGFVSARAGMNGDGLRTTAGAMAQAVRHRGPDDAGAWADAQAGVALGHVRLAILDLSPAGHQPMVSASGRFVIAFNGEVYNHLDLRAELEAAGAAPAWRGRSDTETLLAGVARWGVVATLQRCVGMFAITAIGLLGLYFVSPSSTAVDRTGLYLLSLQFMVFAHLPEVIGSRNGNNDSWVMAVLAYYAAVQFVWLNFATHAYAWIPYRWYLLEWVSS